MSPSSFEVSSIGTLADGGRPLNQLLVNGRGWEKKSQLKEGLPSGSLGGEN